MIVKKTLKEIEIMRKGGKILAQIMERLKKKVRPNIKTIELENLAEKLISEYKVKPSFKGYNNFPFCLCTSINEEIVHGLPSQRVLKEGDILSLDLGIIYKGFHADMAVTIGVGKISFLAQRLIRVTKKALKLAIKKAKIGNTFGDIGNTIQRYVESQGFNVVRDLCGHGIGRKLHEEPQVLNYGKRHKGEKIEKGMVFCIEPMVVVGNWQIEKAPDGFCWKTKDNSLSAHFEHTIAVLEKGPEILTSL